MKTNRSRAAMPHLLWRAAVAALAFACITPARADDPGVTAACDQFAATGLSGVSANVIALAAGGYRMYYMGQGMSSAFSSDGVSWTVDPGTRLGPVPNDAVTFVSNPWVFLTRDGSYRMIYEGRDAAGNRRLYSAISSDSLYFTRESQVMAGASVDTNRSGTMFLSVPAGLRLPDGSLRMYYVSDGADTRSAVSADDGLTWTPDAGTRLFQAVDPVVYADGSGYSVIYTDFAVAMRTKRLFIGTSSDGLNFTLADSPIVSVTNSTYNVVDPEVITIGGAKRLYFSVMTSQTAPPSENTNPIYTCVLPQPFSMSASATGPLTSLSLTGSVTVASTDVGKPGNFYLAAQVGGTLYLNDGKQWRAYVGGALPVYARGTLAARSIPILAGFDVSGLIGTAIYVGYGVSDADLLSGKYALVYTIH